MKRILALLYRDDKNNIPLLVSIGSLRHIRVKKTDFPPQQDL